MRYLTIQSIVLSILIGISLGLGFGGKVLGGVGNDIACARANTCSALSAAPLNTTFIVPGFQDESSSANSPPEYSSVAFSNIHFLQLSPSSWIIPLRNSTSSKIIDGNGGTLGIQSSEEGLSGATAADACVNIDAYMNRNAEQQPNANQPKDQATLYIHPPLNNERSGQCVVLHFHNARQNYKPNDSSVNLLEMESNVLPLQR